MKNRSRLTALLLALLMLMSALPVPALADDVITTMDDYQDAMQRLKDALNEPSIPQEQENAYTITRSAQIDAIVHETITGVIAEDGDNTFTLPVAGKLMLSTAEAAEAYQWQISADGVWANIVGDSAAEIALTYAKIQNALSGGAAIVRCALTRGGEVSYSPEAIVAVDMTPKTETTTVEETIPAVSFYAPAAQSQARALNAYVLDNEDERTTYDIVINYLLDGEVVSDPYTANLAAGESFRTTVTFPTIQGYLPYVGEEQINSIDLNYPAISENVTINVDYKPTNVNYTVIHYQQNVNDDNYTEFERETKQGLTESTVPEVAKSYDGFYALVYERPAIAADGSTVIEVYYDRYYYLMNFDLDGGYGVEPIYARYGTSIGDVGTPTKAGYSFSGWSLDGTNTVDLPTDMPAENRTYKAVWTSDATAKVTVVFWGENADDEEYSYIKSAQVNVKPGTEFTYSESGSLICALEVHTHNLAECYKLTCTQEVHTHSEACYTTCGQTEHTAHTKGCYAGVGNEQDVYTDVPNNPKDGQVVDHWYYGKLIYINGSWYRYSGTTKAGSIAPTTCHKHSDNCLGCGKTEHTHSVENKCYNFTCTKTEHTHNSDCYMNGAGLDKNLWKFVRSDTVTVAADGSSVVNVYYDRLEKTLTFKYNYSDRKGYQTTETITAKWGEDISTQYKKIASNAKSTFWTLYSNGNGPYTNYFGIMPQEAATYYNRGSSGEDGTMTYWGQDQNGNYTVKLFEVTGVGGYTVTTEDRYAFKGFTYDHGTSNGSDCNGATFYYKRNTYTLTFNDGYNDVKTEKVKYEAPLSTYKDYVPAVPSEYEAGSVEFGGWYLNPECTGNEYKLDKHNMPADNVLLYAKWVPVTHTVKTYLTKVEMDEGKAPTNTWTAVPHGTAVTNPPKDPVNGQYTFVGWFYISDTGEEKAFDFSMPVNRDLNLYAKWIFNRLKQYTVQYVLKDDPNTKVAGDLTGSGLAGTTKTFDAKGGPDLYADYQERYFPTVQSQSLLLDIDSDNLMIIFEYVRKEAVPYTVKYINTETNNSVFDDTTIPDKVVEDNRKAVVTEKFELIPGYMPDAYQKRLVVTAGGENILYFYYTKDTTHAYYKITHYTENLAKDAEGKTTWTEYASSQAVGDIGTTYSADPMTIPGFTYDSSVQGTVTSGKLTGNGLELKLYYTRNSYPYQVRYLEQGSGKVLADPKNETGKYGQVISESAIDIANYDAVDPTSQTLNIRIEEGTEAKLNVITFYYKEKEVAINYVAVGPNNVPLTESELTTIGSVAPTSENVKLITGTAQGSTATLIGGPTYRFVGWYSDADCTALVSSNARFVPTQPSHDVNGEEVKDLWVAATYYAKFEYNLTTLTITKSGAAVNANGTGLDAGQSFLFKVTGEGLPKDGLLIAINGNGSETISGLTVGQTYTVTEVESWSWRYTATAQKITLGADASKNKVTIDNARDETQWLDGDCYAENNFGAVNSEN